ncbi:MAG: hypothetical protein QME96_16695 [Myxococcota bacterium]|nr:hypothetical protein [Myxococcota bacterium]
MTLLFGICLAVGGVTSVVSLVLGGHGEADAGADGPLDPHVDVGGDFWLLFGSTRFWIFFLTFFGLAGLLFQLAGASDIVALLLSLPLGAGLGLGAAHAFRRLAAGTVSSGLSPDDLIGVEARVLLPIGRGRSGKVRVEAKETILDRAAVTEEEGIMERGDRVLVIGVRDAGLVVARAPEGGRPAPADGGDAENAAGRGWNEEKSE